MRVKPIIIGWAALGMAMTVSGCSSHAAGGGPAPEAVISHRSSVKVLGSASLSTRPLWSPSGHLFAFNIAPDAGTAVLGFTSPLRTRTVELGAGRHLVALTAHDAVAASASYKRDWLYPLHNDRLGKPIPWNAATDTWQEWVDTQQGPAIVTGGYGSQKAALTESTGTRIPLSGSQVFVSPDGKYGAVVGGHRLPRNVQGGGTFAPSRYQPSPTTGPIVLWNFDAAAPHAIATIHLPKVRLPKAAGGALVGYLAISPNDQYLAVSVTGNDGVGDRLVGKTFLYRIDSGTLVGSAPYGNGMLWALDSQDLWLGTPLPQGHGTDRLVNVHGAAVWTWPDAATQSVVMPVSAQTLLVVRRRHLEVWRKTGGFTALAYLRMYPPAAETPAPSGSGILMNVGGQMLYWAAKR